MFTFYYEDFTFMFTNLNKELFLNVNEYAIDLKGQRPILGPLIVTTKKSTFNFDLSKLGYTPTKMTMLINTYVLKDEYKGFKEKLKNATGHAITFNFNPNKPKKGTSGVNGSCLLSIVLTRPNKNNNWKYAFVHYRATEINRRFAADLALLSMWFKEFAPEVGKIVFVIPSSYINVRAMVTYRSLFDFSWHELTKGNPVHDYAIKFKEQVLEGPINPSYKSVARMKAVYNGSVMLHPLVLTEKIINDYLHNN